MSRLQIIETGDGSHTLLNADLDETYHSRHGALRESKHVFIQHGLHYWLSTHTSSSSVRILEVGLGTGLNAWLTLLEADKLAQVQFEYTALEPHPVESAMIQQLNYVQQSTLAEKKHFEAIHQADWNQPQTLLGNFILNKQTIKLEELDDRQAFDVIYYDAFAPNKQPELWEKPIIEKVTNLLAPTGVWVTYSAKGQLKRDLKSLGLQVETLPGPPGKAEMVRAIKL
ncbi:MAG: tRNA (5-methylaminomethyl-2-thiouridine)(34)-methyltransferase MnmD [Tunicatimonas sp.]|uniref:tRNA (5-methylaminomethyl-2-thiouridine)(34)-methyltransferase MnmD n=1 Tax=Tunicatimonas sp. TaxID=1940096 RepID=UPI003C77167F